MSQPRSRTPLVVAACLLLGLAAYVGHLVSGAELRDGPDLMPSIGDVVEPGQVDRAVADQAFTDQIVTAAADEPQFDVVLRIDPVADLVPPPPRRPDLRLWRGTTLVPAEATWVAGTAALPEARVVQGRQLVRFRVPGGRDIFRVVVVRRTNQGPIDVRWLGSVDYQGQVVGADKSPIAGASVWFAGERAETGADGRFRIPDLPRGAGLPLVIRAAGHAGYFGVRDLIHPDNGRDISQNTFGLAPGVDLQVRFVAPVEDLTKGAVFVQPAGPEQDTRLLHHPFLMQAVEGGVPLGSDGTATVMGLPAGVKVRVCVRHPDTLVQQQPVVDLRKQGQPQASVQADRAWFLVGKVRGTANQPVPGAWLVSRRAGATAPPLHSVVDLLPPFLYLGNGSPIGHAITTADGSYRLPLGISTDKAAQVRAAAPERHGLALQARAPKERVVERDLVLPRAVGKDGPRLKLCFANASGRTFRLQVMEGRRRVQQPFLLRDTDDYAQPLSAMVLADIRVEVRGRDGNVRRWAFENSVVQGLLELPLDY